ncbi:MAG TPA: TetR/AcrR family transcriptional regulator C-terminal ligand-binding domain-containing protein [Pseudonocardiaceae bacterium]|jgi:AcrR family transcriptional regulator|nr:TetR/AcrR family transcriptional regulator C-terminal ligand-binding domain-containing protein [Pseudonocardiaceae bacterium]
MVTTEQQRPGGRSARVQAAVRTAVVDLICDPGHEPVTIPVVAAKAGVNPTSIYRRWGDIQSLLADIAISELDADTDVPDTGDLTDDLHVWVDGVLDYLKRPGGISFLRTAVNMAVDEEGRQRCLRNRRTQLGLMLGSAVERGEPVPPLDRVMDKVVAPLYFRVLFGIPDTDHAYARGLVDEVLAESRPGATPRR